MKHEDAFLKGDEIDLVSKCDGGVAEAVKAAKELAKNRIFTHPRKVELEIGSYSVMATLLEVMCSAVVEYSADPKKCSFKSKRVVDLIGPGTFDPRAKNHPDGLHPDGLTPQYVAIMRVIDFISGCTDHYATYLAKQFNGMGEAR